MSEHVDYIFGTQENSSLKRKTTWNEVDKWLTSLENKTNTNLFLKSFQSLSNIFLQELGFQHELQVRNEINEKLSIRIRCDSLDNHPKQPV